MKKRAVEKSRLRILLAYKAHAAGASDPYSSLLPIGLGYINGLLRAQGFHARIANLSKIGWQEIRALLKRERPHILGVSQFTHNRFESLRLASLAKELDPSCLVVLGGPHATHRAREMLSGSNAVDAVVIGEGEKTFLDIAICLTTKDRSLASIKGVALRKGGDILFTPPRQPLADLDSLPQPAPFYDNAIGVDILRQLEFIITSRGCPAACRFCSSPRFWGRTLRFRSARSVVDEIKFIRDRYGLLYFSIRDDTFTADRRRVEEICRLLLEEKVYILWECQSRVNAVDAELLVLMKRAGCECVQFGVESGSPRLLRRLGKSITREQAKKAAAAARRAGINLSIYLITGIPGETEEDLEATLSLIEELKPSDGQVSPLAYYPGTRLFEEAVDAGNATRDMFEADQATAFYLRNDPFVRRSTKAMLSKIGKTAEHSQMNAERLRTLKKTLGYCHANNVLAGEFYENRGSFRRAEAEYREIVEAEPANPWGWLMLAELYGRLGHVERGAQAFGELLRLVPRHLPAYVQLGELYMSAAEFALAERMFMEALELDPGNEGAAEGLADVRGKK